MECYCIGTQLKYLVYFDLFFFRPVLALEYQGKATKLRQTLYGENHEITKKSLDFFTVIYGHVGRQQYSGIYCNFYSIFSGFDNSIQIPFL